MFTLSLFLCSVAALIVPGAWVCTLLFPEKTTFERWTYGATIGLAGSVYLAVVLSYVRLSLFWPSWALASLIALVLLLRQRPRVPIFQRPTHWHLWLGLILLLVAVSRFYVAFLRELPLGWDSSFHLILAKKISLANGMIGNWEPFEQIALNYPIGSHFLVVIVSNMSGLPLHVVFKLLIPLLGVLTTAQIYMFCWHVCGMEEVSLFAALAYGLWAAYGSIDYSGWGGLPNCLGMVFLMALLTFLVEAQWTQKHTVLLSLFFVSIFLTHHHVMVTAGFILFTLFLLFSWRRGSGKSVGVACGLAGSLLLGSFYIVPYVLKVRSIGSTSVFMFQEQFFGLKVIILGLGVVFSGFSLIGIPWYPWNKFRSQGTAVLSVVSASLLGLFVFFEYVYRFLSPYFFGQQYIAFTPSRFLTDLVYFLSIFAGYAAYQVRRALHLQLAVAIVLGVCLASANFPLWRKLSDRWVGPRPGLWQAYQWIEKNTPQDTIVLTIDPWAPYGTWRRTVETPIPVSEPSTANTPKAMMMRDLKAGLLPKEARLHKLVAIARPWDAGKAGQVLWKEPSGWAVIEVCPGGNSKTADRMDALKETADSLNPSGVCEDILPRTLSISNNR